MNEKSKLTKAQRRENYIKKLKKQLEYQNNLNELMKINVIKYYISKLELERKLEEVQKEYCSGCCSCGLCDELEKMCRR